MADAVIVTVLLHLFNRFITAFVCERDPDSLVVGWVKRTKATGEVEGRMSSPLAMTDIPRTQRLSEKDKVVTYGVRLRGGVVVTVGDQPEDLLAPGLGGNHVGARFDDCRQLLVEEALGVGAQQLLKTAERLEVAAGGSQRLAKLFERSARQMGVRARQSPEPVDLSIVFEEKSRQERGQEAPEVILTWEGWEATSHTAQDTLERLSAEQLERAGRALTMALMVLGRELQY